MKKKLNFLICTCITFALSFCTHGAFADELEDVQMFFENYVNAANSYSKAVVNFYLPDAKIIRVVQKPDNTMQTVDFSMQRYKSELKKGQSLARLSRYKNAYTERKFEKLSDGDYKISALRTPNDDKKALPFYFIVTKTNDGWKVKEEFMTTTVQKFLTSK